MTVRGMDCEARRKRLGRVGASEAPQTSDTHALPSVNGDGAVWPFV
jgi:hypothetical protein